MCFCGKEVCLAVSTPLAIVFLRSTDVVVIIFTIVRWAASLRTLLPWNQRIKEVTKGLERRQKMLEEEIIYDDRRLNHADRAERQLQGLLSSLPLWDCRPKYDSCLRVVSPDNETNWLLHREEFKEWVFNSSSKILWVYGKREWPPPSYTGHSFSQGSDYTASRNRQDSDSVSL